jgi:hypothetical protein
VDSRGVDALAATQEWANREIDGRHPTACTGRRQPCGMVRDGAVHSGKKPRRANGSGTNAASRLGREWINLAAPAKKPERLGLGRTDGRRGWEGVGTARAGRVVVKR